MRLQKSFVCATASAVLVGLVGLSAPLVSNASAAPGTAVPGSVTSASGVLRGMGGHVMTGPTGNKVEMVDPAQSTYVPRIGRASERDRAKAQRLLDGANQFCRNHTAKGIKARWEAGTSRAARPTHYYNPRTNKGLHPANPRAALIYEGRLGGIMFTGSPLPSLGSIPRAHSHDMSMGVEMVHVYCASNLKEAFTPNRVLGVKADTIALRLKIRPAVMDLNKRHLRAVRHMVRGYAGDKLKPVKPVWTSGRGPDPVLKAMRTEIRNSLMILHERQLRSVWALMRSY